VACSSVTPAFVISCSPWPRILRDLRDLRGLELSVISVISVAQTSVLSVGHDSGRG